MLEKRDLGLTLSKEEILDKTNYFDQLKRYLAGTFKLRQFDQSISPRSLITKAEKELNKNNIQEAINLLKQLPKNWKNSISQFLLKADQTLNKSILSE